MHITLLISQILEQKLEEAFVFKVIILKDYHRASGMQTITAEISKN